MSPGRRFAIVTAPVSLGGRTFPPLVLVLLAALGASVLVAVASERWGTPSDEYAYWLAAQRLVAGQPLYDPALPIGTPYSYWYPPLLAQVLAPLTPILSDTAYIVGWTALLLTCLWLLGDRRILVALALVAFVPVAVELWYRNVHLLLALLFVLALRRHPVFWVPAAAVKITPVIGVVYLVARGRVREAVVVSLVGMGVLAASATLAPAAWIGFLDLVASQGDGASTSFIPLPYLARLAVAVALAVVAGRLGERMGEVLLIVALVVGNPSLTMTAFSMLIAVVPLLTVQGRWPRPLQAADTASGA